MEDFALSAVPPMRLLVVHPGADWSVSDVFDGYAPAFRALGHTVGQFNLHIRVGRAMEWLDWNWEKAGEPVDDRPNAADALYLAGADMLAAAVRGDVDWVIIFSGMYVHPDVLVMLRRAGKQIALILTESPYEDDAHAKILPLATVAWTNERTSVDVLREINPNVLYLPTSYDPARHFPLDATLADADVAAHDVVFVGTGFQERLDALAAVDWDGLGIDLGLYGTYELLPADSPLHRYIRGGPVANVTTAALYRRAKIGLNLYRRSMAYGVDEPRIDTAESLNPRAIELAACGVFTISDHRAESQEVFGDLIPTFTDPSELGPLLRRWLDDDAGRAAIAAQLPERVARWTFLQRAEHVAALLWSVQSRQAHSDCHPAPQPGPTTDRHVASVT
jgi:hypothetical protein